MKNVFVPFLRTAMNKVNAARLAWIIAGICSLVFGVLIYYFFRTRELLLLNWFTIKIDNSALLPKQGPFWSFFAYNLPDGLWLISGFMLIKAIWWNEGKFYHVYKNIFCLSAFGFELLQILPNIPGTFDVLDLILMMTICFLESILHKFCFKRSLRYA
jgi:hypothetical protein